jgi:hypothetical protein
MHLQVVYFRKQNGLIQILVGAFNNMQLTPWSWVLLEKPPVAQLLKNFHNLYGTRRFITVLVNFSYPEAD